MRWEAFGIALLCTALLVLVQGMGAFDTLDAAVYRHLDTLKDAPSREEMPLVIGLDKALFDRWGTPPWSATHWQELAVALRKAHVGKVYVVDSLGRLYREGEVAAIRRNPSSAMSRLLVPWRVKVSSLSAGSPSAETSPAARRQGTAVRERLQGQDAELQPPFERWSHYLAPARDPDGVFRDFHREGLPSTVRFGQSAFCSWVGRCPGETLRTLVVRGPDKDSRVPYLSALDFLDGHASLASRESKNRIVLLGLMDPELSDLERVGVRAVEVPFVEGIAWVIGSARSRPSLRVPSKVELSILCVVFLLFAIAVHRFRYLQERSRYLLALSALAVPLAAGLYFFDVVRLPLTVLITVLWIPPFVSSLRGKSGVLTFLRQSARVILREGFRHAPVGALIRSEEDLLERLANLSRTYTKQGKFLYFHYDPVKRRLVQSSRFGIDPSSLLSYDDKAGSSPWSHAISSFPHGVWSNEILRSTGNRVLVHALMQRGDLVGAWCLVLEEEEPNFDAGFFRQIVVWLCDRLALEMAGAASLRQKKSTEDRIEEELGQLKKLVMAAAEERRQQFDTLQSLSTPLLVADITGSALYVNRSLEKILAKAGIDSVRSMRELLFRFGGEKQVQTLLPRLFLRREAVETMWESPDGQLYQLRLAPIHSGSHRVEDTVSGFVAALENMNASAELRRVRSEVASFSTMNIRNDLMVVASAMERSRLQMSMDDASIDASAGNVGVGEDYHRMKRSIGGIIRMTDYLKAALEIEEDRDDTVVPLDVTSYLRDLFKKTQGVQDGEGEDQQLRVDMDMPFAAMPVLATPASLRRELARLVERACSDTVPGGRVFVRVKEHVDMTEVELLWDSHGIDPSLVDHFSSLDSDELPSELRPFFAAREVFPDLSLRGGPGEATKVTFSLARAH